MKLSINKTLENNIYGVTMKFIEYGSTNMTADEEKCIIEDFVPSFKYSNITFTDKYIFDDKEKTVKKSDGTTTDKEQQVNLVINDKIVLVNDNLELKYVIKTEQILDSEIGKSLSSKELVAQAKVQLYIDKIVETITKTMTDLKAKHTPFEKVEEVTI